MAPLFPLMLNLADRQVVVVGGGAVGSRKALAALNAGARVRLVDPFISQARQAELAAQRNLVWMRERYCPDHLQDCVLAFAAATPEVNAAVVADANLQSIWVNSASDPTSGDFILPSVIRSGTLTLAASTGGAAPALARRICEKLEKEFDASFGDWLEVLAELRVLLLATVAEEARRRQLLDHFADWPWLERIQTEGVDAVRNAMIEIVNNESGAR